MLSLNRKEKVFVIKMARKLQQLVFFACQTKRCSVETLYCRKFSNFSNFYTANLTYNVVKKHYAPKLQNWTLPSTLKFLTTNFPAFMLYILKNSKVLCQNSTIVELEYVINGVDNTNPKEEFHPCQRSLLDLEFEKTRHSVFK